MRKLATTAALAAALHGTAYADNSFMAVAGHERAELDLQTGLNIDHFHIHGRALALLPYEHDRYSPREIFAWLEGSYEIFPHVSLVGTGEAHYNFDTNTLSLIPRAGVQAHLNVSNLSLQGEVSIGDHHGLELEFLGKALIRYPQIESLTPITGIEARLSGNAHGFGEYFTSAFFGIEDGPHRVVLDVTLRTGYVNVGPALLYKF